MSKKKKECRIEFVLDCDQKERACHKASVSGKSLANVIRGLLSRWELGTVFPSSNDYESDTNICHFEMYSDPHTLYDFSVLAAKRGYSRVELLQKLMADAVSGKVKV